MRNRARFTIALACLALGGPLAAQTITEFPLPGSEFAIAIAAGPDGNLWFTDDSVDQIGRITREGVITQFAIPTAQSGPLIIAAGPDGNLWFVEGHANQIGRISPTGVVTEFQIPTPGSTPRGIVTGPDGNVWFTEFDGNQIGRITTAGVVTEFPLPTALSSPNGIAAGPDGNLWFTDMAGIRVSRITTAGVVTEFPLQRTSGGNGFIYPGGIAAGPDGNLWFTLGIANKIVRMTTTGVLTEFRLGDAGFESAFPRGIAAGPDGNLWFTRGNDKIGRISTAGVITEFPLANSGAQGIAAGPYGELWFAEDGAIGRVTTGPCASDASGKTDVGEGALDVSSGAAGQTSLLFWVADRLSVRTIDASCLVANTPFEGPFSGWNATAIADGPDGLSRVLWQSLDGRVGLEYIDSAGSVAAVHLPADPAWTAIDVSVGTDRSAHLLRTSGNGRARITSVPSSGQTTEGPTYGPYSGWSARALADGPDGATWVLWQGTDGAAGIARYRDGAYETAFRWGADPGWASEDITVGRDGIVRVLRTNADGRMEIASVDAQGKLFDWAAYTSPGQRARRIAASPDGLTRVLWTTVDRSGSLWILNPDNSVISPPTPPPPPPPTTGIFSGAWTGTYQGDALEGCVAGPAEATFEQQDSTVTGLVTTTANNCGPRHRTLHCTAHGQTLIGTLTEGGFSFDVYGVLAHGVLDIAFSNSYGFAFGHLNLHR